MKKIFSIFVAILLAVKCLNAQSGEEKKISLAQDLGEGFIVNLYHHGLAIKTIKGKEVQFSFYDQNLKKSGNASFAMEDRREVLKNYYYDSLINRIVVFHGTKRKTFLTLIEPSTKKKKLIELTVAAKKTLIGTSFVKLDKNSFIVTSKSAKTLLNTLDLASGEITPVELPKEWKAREILNTRRVNSKYMAVFYLDKTVKNHKFKNIALFNDQGEPMVDQLLSNEAEDFPIEEYSITDMGNEEFAIAGTYSKSVNTSYSIGLFVAKIENLKLSYIKYFDYNTIKNFYNFLSDKRKEKAEKKAAKNAERGRSTNYLALTHPVILVDGRFIVTAEFYYPTYRTETSTTYINGRPTTTTRSVFDGFQYTHTMVLGIDDNGEKTFEHCIPLHLDYKPYFATQKLKRSSNESEIKYSYIAANKIFSFSVEDAELKEHVTKTLVEVEDDKKVKRSYSSIDSWYDNYFYAKTEQTTKEKGKLIGNKETNYFLIKYKVD